MGFSGGSVVENLPADAGDSGLIPGLRRFPWSGKRQLTHILSWRIPWTEEPGGLQSVGSPKSWTWFSDLSINNNKVQDECVGRAMLPLQAVEKDLFQASLLVSSGLLGISCSSCLIDTSPWSLHFCSCGLFLVCVCVCVCVQIYPFL